MTSSESWIDADRKHVWHPYTHSRSAPPPLPVASAQGVYLHTADGRRVLDGISSWWVNIVGHSHPRLVSALERQARTLQQVVFAGCTHEPAARLAARLAGVAPGELPHVFFSDDGSTAVEVGLKIAAQYWRHVGKEERTLFIALERAYHGDTFGAMAAGGIPLFREAFGPLLFEVIRVPAPTCHACPDGHDRDACVRNCTQHLEQVLQKEAHRTAAMIIEPILQGAGGMLVWPAEFLRAVREITRRHGVLLIADEVLTGFGRTGKLFACEHGSVTPDILCLSKALTGGVLPLGATLTTDRVHEPFECGGPHRTFFHGHSYTANALACAAALETISIMEDERLLSRVLDIEEMFRAWLERMRTHPAVGHARGIGAVAALELAPPRGTQAQGAAALGEESYLEPIGRKLHAAFLGRNILLRPLGNVLYFLPPYVITPGEVHETLRAIESVLDTADLW